MNDELSTVAKAMYKLEPIVELGGEMIIFAPHLYQLSVVHECHIRASGYRILNCYLQDWDRLRDVQPSILAHSTHARGSGVMENGIEMPNVRVTSASSVPPDFCAELLHSQFANLEEEPTESNAVVADLRLSSTETFDLLLNP